MLNIGITGNKGFIGWHLKQWLLINNSNFNVINFESDFFLDENKIDSFVIQCDIIIHLAGVNRHNDDKYIFDKNIELANILVKSFERIKFNGQLIFSSSIHEENQNLFGKSKRKCRKIFEKWSLNHRNKFIGLIIPNVFGPFTKPFYNSVIATFSYQLINNKKPKIKTDASLKLIYIDELIKIIIKCFNKASNSKLIIKPTNIFKVSDILILLKSFHKKYIIDGVIPNLSNPFHLHLFNTFRSYIDLNKKFPIYYNLNQDQRGSFIELTKSESGGQISYSTTKKNIIRGNHFHTRKIERFSVIKGDAIVELRKISTNKIYKFQISGEKPCYIDIPIWYTHNLTNKGDKELITVFWINEPYKKSDPDTYLKLV